MSDFVAVGVTTPTTTPVYASGINTCQDLIEATRALLMTGSRDERNVLSADVAIDSDTVALAYPVGSLRQGARLGIELEDLYVFGAVGAGSGSTATVQRGQWGSVPSGHAVNSTVLVNPKFSDFDIFRALNDTLRSLSSEGLFRIKTIDLTYSPAIQGYDLAGITSDFIDVYEVRAKPVGPSRSWPKIASYTVLRNMPTSEFASGDALVLYEGASPGRTIHVRYKAAFGLFSYSTDDALTTTGLWTEAIDLLPLGAAIRLTEGREIKRNFTETQGDTRRAAEVPAGANLNAPRQLEQEFAKRVSSEASRLQSEYPVTRGYL